jgi:class 3 adenylate cyclase
MTEIVLHDDGTLDKYVGDEIMAFWGRPYPETSLPRMQGGGEDDGDLHSSTTKGEDGKAGAQHRHRAQYGGHGRGKYGFVIAMDYTLMGDNVISAPGWRARTRFMERTSSSGIHTVREGPRVRARARSHSSEGQAAAVKILS